MTNDNVERWAARLRTAMQSRTPIAPLRSETQGMDAVAVAGMAYAVQQLNLAHALADGGRIVGRKIGLTSAAV